MRKDTGMLAVSTHKGGGGWADEEAGRPASLPASPSDKIEADPNGVAFIHGDGVVLLKMLTGKLPANTVPGFDGVDLSQWVRRGAGVDGRGVRRQHRRLGMRR
uniref:Uncharacterized protein n=1 Tax=Oryza sativa subsp. japonica TaxID=39947 RepID=Q6Z359_ORYSJ|nr:hypothetical protein [Oryza sativa Japonica Group]